MPKGKRGHKIVVVRINVPAHGGEDTTQIHLIRFQRGVAATDGLQGAAQDELELSHIHLVALLCHMALDGYQSFLVTLSPKQMRIQFQWCGVAQIQWMWRRIRRNIAASIAAHPTANQEGNHDLDNDHEAVASHTVGWRARFIVGVQHGGGEQERRKKEREREMRMEQHAAQEHCIASCRSRQHSTRMFQRNPNRPTSSVCGISPRRSVTWQKNTNFHLHDLVIFLRSKLF
mmetsp:Transcript_10252/g.28143  ORF Transcript_10252/g.28143 Transcript_10252/m.28143 type:complete len:231 (+) Transcript_10252:592-1284(+)